MNSYRQSIILFGIVLPVVVTAGVVGLFSLLKAKMVTSFENKQATHKTYEMGRLAGLEIESQVARQRPHVERWVNQLSQETASTATSNIRDICEHLPGKEIQHTAFDRTDTKAGFGAVSGQDSSQIRIAFRGTYRTMQKALFQLETRMPQLVLQDLQISPSSNQSTLLNFQVTYTAWEN